MVVDEGAGALDPLQGLDPGRALEAAQPLEPAGEGRQIILGAGGDLLDDLRRQRRARLGPRREQPGVAREQRRERLGGAALDHPAERPALRRRRGGDTPR